MYIRMCYLLATQPHHRSKIGGLDYLLVSDILKGALVLVATGSCILYYLILLIPHTTI